VNHVAIDLGSKESQVCVRRADGTIELEKKHPTRRLDELLRTVPPSRVIVETSSEAFRIADAAKAAGHEVRVVPSTLSKQLGVGERGVKTDLRDARKLSQVSCQIDLPSVHIPSEAARNARSVLRSREALIETRTKLINHVRGWMRTQLWKLRGRGTSTLPKRLREQASTDPTRALPDHIEQVLTIIDALNAQMRLADQQVKDLARSNPVCVRLMTTPGVGPVTALSFVAAIDDPTRFPHAYQVASYLGLTPGEDSSSERQRRTGITKAGPASLRRTLIQAAWTALRARPDDPMVRWALQIAERRPKPVAVVALARKMSCILFALWRDGSTYKPELGARLPEAPTT
jgi:transposase